MQKNNTKINIGYNQNQLRLLNLNDMISIIEMILMHSQNQMLLFYQKLINQVKLLNQSRMINLTQNPKRSQVQLYYISRLHQQLGIINNCLNILNVVSPEERVLQDTQFKLKMIEEDLIKFIPTFLQEDCFTYKKEGRLENFSQKQYKCDYRDCQTTFYECKYFEK